MTARWVLRNHNYRSLVVSTDLGSIMSYIEAIKEDDPTEEFHFNLIRSSDPEYAPPTQV